MIISFEFSNIYSFKEKQRISFEPESLKELKNHLHQPLSDNSKEELLKSLAIYGHNSHGKSNFIKSLVFFRDFVLTSFVKPHQLRVEPFLLNTGSQNEPSFFEIILYINNIRYRYGFEIKLGEIISEWLFYNAYGVRENHIFQRFKQDFLISKTWNKENGNKIEIQAIPFAKPHVLLFSVLISQEVTQISEISKVISEITIVNSIDQSVINKAVDIFSHPDNQEQISRFIKNADLGFTTIFDKIERQLKATGYEEGLLNIIHKEEISRFELYTSHDVYNEKHAKIDSIKFDLFKNESDGTVKFFILASLLVYSIKNEILICMDELDAKLHPDLLLLMINEYHNSTLNSSGAQLIFTTHNTILLDKQMRRDQFIVIEKNEYGESSLRKIHTKDNPVRIDSSMEKEYRKGKLGGVSKKIVKNLNQTSLFD